MSGGHSVAPNISEAETKVLQLDASIHCRPFDLGIML